MSGTIFVTGGTGLVGHFLMLALLRQGHRLVVLSRPGKKVSARMRIDRLMLEVYPTWEMYQPDRARIEVVEGDLRIPQFGFGDETWRDLTERVTAVAHCGALLNFTPEADEEVLQTNMMGTLSAHRLAREAGLKTLHHVSTAYVVGAARGPQPERRVGEEPTFNNTYERSKFLSEKKLGELDAEFGIQTTIYRPSCVVGAFGDGRTLTFRTLYGYIDLFDQERRRILRSEGVEALHRYRPIYMMEIETDRTRNVVPADFVADSMAEIMARPTFHGGVYHLTNPAPPSRWESNRWMVKGVGFKDLVLPSYAAANPSPDLLEVAPGRANRFRQLFGGYLIEPEPYFLIDNTRAALEGSGIACPVTDEEYIQRVVRYCVDTRWRVDVERAVDEKMANVKVWE